MVAWLKKYSILDVLCVLLLLVFTCTLVMTFFHVSFYDEQAWFLVSGRAIYNGFKYQHFYFQCSSNLTWDIPWFLLPGRIVVSLLHPASYDGLRVMGITIYLLLIAVSSFIVKSTFSHLRWLPITAFITALLSLGIFPYRAVSVRPESSVALGILLLFALFSVSRKLNTTLSKSLLVILFLCICSWFFGIHPKTVLFVPSIALIGFLLLRDQKIAGYLVLILVCVMAWQSYTTWKHYSLCPDLKSIERSQKKHSLTFDVLTHRPKLALDVAIKNLKKAHLYLDGSLFKERYYVTDTKGKHSPFLRLFEPVKPFSRSASKPFNLIIKSIVYCLIVFTVIAVTMVAYSSRARKTSPPAEWWVAVMLGASLFVFICVKSAVVEYEVPFVWPVFIVVSLITVIYAYGLNSEKGSGKKIFYGVVLVSILSQIYAAIGLLPYLQSQYAVRTNNYKKSQYAPVYSPQYMQNIEVVKNYCITDVDNVRTIFSDVTSYLAFYTSRNVTMVGRKTKFIFNNKNINIYHPFMVVMRCIYLPKSIRKYSIRNGNLCCLTSDMLP